MKKRLLQGLIAAAATSVFFSSAAGFTKDHTYTPGQFSDVSDGAWYASEVKSAYELGLMNGIGGGLFDPEGTVTVAEAVTMAARAASVYAGEEILPRDGEWYQPYVAYALQKGFVSEGAFDSFDRPAKRYEVASLFENAMPAGYYVAQNEVKAIPDADASLPYAADLLTLYRAGVVMGSDAFGNFRPEDNVSRAEAAAIVNRVALPANRLKKTLDVTANDDAYPIALNTSYQSNKEGIGSGWRLDNRGGVPRNNIDGGYGLLADISETQGTAMIREFNDVRTGVVTLATSLAAEGTIDGVILEFRNEAGESVYKIIAEDGAWKYENADKTRESLCAARDASGFSFRIVIDLDNGRSTTFINGENCGTYPLCVPKDAADLMNFRFATTAQSTAVVSFGAFELTANYAVYDDFDFDKDREIPFGWTGVGTENRAGVIRIGENGSLRHDFSPVSGTVVSRFEANLDKGQALVYEMKSGEKTIVRLSADEKNLYANGVPVYENYVQGLWYRFSVDVRTLENKADIRVNGRKTAEVGLLEKTTSIDGIRFSNASADAFGIERVRVFKKITHEDYVPEPVRPRGEEKHTVGINCCSLWRNGEHFGWSCISAYDDVLPVLGYYDEGNPETADWEIKYMTEHGIDFQAFCWYSDQTDGVIKDPKNAEHLYNGYMYAKYSDRMKYCIIWEAANAGKPTSVESFKKYYAPYFVENFFKDDRYMTIGNRPVVCMFGPASFAGFIGGEAKVKECFNYLEEQAVKLGFDGVLYLACGSSSQTLADMGFDGCFAYNWNTTGYDLGVNKKSILNSAANASVYTVPTISVGFNSIAWSGTRYPMMTPADFEAGHRWIVEEYLPANAKEDWQKDFSMISTWNEYGEGTYIMPTSGNGGFGYLDALRSVYTDEKTDERLNAVPTAEQKERIDRLFPQYRRLLRRQGHYKKNTAENLVAVKTFDFTKSDGILVQESKAEFTSDGLKGIVQGDARITVSPEMPASEATHLAVAIEAPKGTRVEIFFITDADKTWTQSKCAAVNTDSDELKTYTLDMSKVSGWNGKILKMRIDPGQSARGTDGNAYRITEAKLMADGEKNAKNLTIDGNPYVMTISPERAGGVYTAAFDPKIAMDYALGAFHTWDAEARTLTLDFADHTVTYTVGSDKYTLDGREKPLGYTMYLVDGLPMIPLETLCGDVGYGFSVNDKNEVCIVTPAKSFYDEKAARTKGEWLFDTPGDAEGWTSNHMSLVTAGGSMKLTTVTATTDPVMSYGEVLNIPAQKYKAFEIRCRYRCDGEKPQHLTVYFTTDTVTSMREGASIKADLRSNDSGGEWETYSVDLTKISAWSGTVKKIRFDPFDTTGVMEIDCMKFIADENYVEPEPEKEGIFGTADNGVGKFFSDNAVITVADDPHHEGNKVYRVAAKEGKNWTYFRYNADFKAGKTYRIEFDVKAYAVGEDAAGKTTIQLNMRYFDANGKADHIAARIPVTVGNDWTHHASSYTVPADSRRGTDQFTVYAEPVGDKSVSFMIDNISVTEEEA